MKQIFFLLVVLFTSTKMFAQGNASKTKQDYIHIYNAQGQFSKQITFDYYESPDQQPSFPGGQDSLYSYIQKNLNYPANAKQNKMQGKVLIRFIVSPTGNIMNIKCLGFPEGGEELQREAQRMVQRMPKWIPGKVANKEVYSEMVLPILFSL